MKFNEMIRVLEEKPITPITGTQETKGSDVWYPIFITIVVLGALLVLFLLLLVIRNRHFSKTVKYSDDTKRILQHKATENKDAIQKCEILSRSQDEYISIVWNLRDINKEIVKQKDQIFKILKLLDDSVANRKLRETLKFKKQVKSLLNEYNENLNKFNIITDKFLIAWQNIEDAFSNYLELTDEFSSIIEKSQKIIPHVAKPLERKITSFNKSLTEMQNSKYKGEFNEADVKMKKLKGQLLDLFKLVSGANRIEHILFYVLPLEIGNKVEKDKNPQTLKIYKDLELKLAQLINNWDKISSESLEKNIKFIYRQFLVTHHATKLSQRIANFVNKNKKIIEQSFMKVQKMHKKINGENATLDKQFLKLELKTNEWLNCKKFSLWKQITEEFLIIYHGYINLYREFTFKNKVKESEEKYQTININKTKEMYFEVINNEMLPKSNAINTKTMELIDIYNKYFKKQKSWNKLQPIWNDFVSNISFLTKGIALNEKYKEMFDKLCLIISQDQIFLLKEDNLTKYKETLANIRLVVAQDNDYKKAYHAIKDYLKKEKYV
ncbi:hypothetical protein H9M94_02480 [Mycoplasma sp. Pen4]|uniref:hypothetical protein n=1 Tax=Mycoplasma sp. Pen4 TaxID=640330 RepID=UPI001653FDCB|nr:hypothetical protein [Mycoplasma sp. Pen4]QNM93453.1 hypothetical protein H9M94_02480 [Mycoplasma sp. Pen4]